MLNFDNVTRCNVNFSSQFGFGLGHGWLLSLSSSVLLPLMAKGFSELKLEV